MNQAQLTPEELDAIRPCSVWTLQRKRDAYAGAERLGLAGIVENGLAADATNSEILYLSAMPYWLDDAELRLLAVRYADAVTPNQSPYTEIFAAIRAHVADPETRPALETALDALRPAGAPPYAEWEAMPLPEKVWWTKKALTARRPWAIAASIAFHDPAEMLRLVIKVSTNTQRAAFVAVLRAWLQSGADLRGDLPVAEV
jgi:hypothetical protein